MFNHNFYKLFNQDLQNLNNNKLFIHWNNIGINENRINSLESFFKKYPYYNHTYGDKGILKNIVEFLFGKYVKIKFIDNNKFNLVSSNLIINSIKLFSIYIRIFIKLIYLSKNNNYYTFLHFKRRFYFIICILSNNILHPCHPARLAVEDNGFLGIIQLEFIFSFVMYKIFSIL